MGHRKVRYPSGRKPGARGSLRIPTARLQRSGRSLGGPFNARATFNCVVPCVLGAQVTLTLALKGECAAQRSIPTAPTHPMGFGGLQETKALAASHLV